MTDPNPLTPPPELVREWTNSAHLSQPNMGAICRAVATQAANWGYQQAVLELEAFARKTQ